MSRENVDLAVLLYEAFNCPKPRSATNKKAGRLTA